MVTEGNKKMPKNADFFYCQQCDFKCSKMANFLAHQSTRKHTLSLNGNKMVTNGNYFVPKNADFSCQCGNFYKHKSGLSRHKKICKNNDLLECSEIMENNSPKSPPCSGHVENNTVVVKPIDHDLIMMLIKENAELKSLMMEVIKNGTSTSTTNNSNNNNSYNKSFNLQFFLNETCKNAMNIMDFAESIQLQLSDLEAVGELGYVDGISNIIVRNLQALDVTERPIHCADKKREVMYIKDEDKWEKEGEDNKKIKKVIKKVECKNQRLLAKYKEEHPGCNMSESQYADQYSKIVIEAMGGAGNNDKEKQDKIISNILKEVVIDKHSIK
jgi:hypothetical protein